MWYNQIIELVRENVMNDKDTTEFRGIPNNPLVWSVQPDTIVTFGTINVFETVDAVFNTSYYPAAFYYPTRTPCSIQ